MRPARRQPNLDTLRRTALALSVSADLLLFDENERGPTDDLNLQFEATNNSTTTKKQTVKRVLEGLLLAHEADAGPHKAAPSPLHRLGTECGPRRCRPRTGPDGLARSRVSRGCERRPGRRAR